MTNNDVALVLSGGTWTNSSLPMPTGNMGSGMSDISCADSTDCVAVGSYKNPSSNEVGLVETYASGTWTETDLPVAWTYYNGPTGVSCADATHCTAIGTAGDYGGPYGSTEWTLSSGTWSLTDGVSGIDTSQGISCWNSSDCMIGGADDSDSYPYPVNGEIGETVSGVYTYASATLFANNTLFNDVSCPSSSACIAVGKSSATSTRTLIETTDPIRLSASGTAKGQGLASRYPGCQKKITPKDPVDCASGDYTETFTDVSVPGRGPGLDLSRTYNSLSASTEGIFGYGWTSSYESNLAVNMDGSITVTEADGSQVTATPDGSGGFIVPSWADSTLVENMGGTYTFIRQQTQTFTYNFFGTAHRDHRPERVLDHAQLHFREADHGDRCREPDHHLLLRLQRLGE